MPDDSRLQRMLDTYEIRDLAQRYAVAVTSRDVDAMAVLFDPEVDNGRFGIGREGTKAFYENFFEQQQWHTFLQVGTHTVEVVDDTTATGVCLTRAWSGWPDERGWSDIMVAYFDTYRRTHDVWGFWHRRETIHCVMKPNANEQVMPGGGGGDQALTNSGGIPRVWEYWDRWKAKLASGTIGQRA